MTIPTEQLLNIPGIRVLSVNYDEKKIECQIESTQGYSICHKCGQKATVFHEHEKELELRHLPVCGRQVILRLRPKRYRCPYCDGVVTTTERPDWYDAKAGCTKVYAEFLLLELVNSTIQDVAKKHSVTYDVVRGALTRYVRGEVSWSQIEVLRVLGLDEISPSASLKPGDRKRQPARLLTGKRIGPCAAAQWVWRRTDLLTVQRKPTAAAWPRNLHV